MGSFDTSMGGTRRTFPETVWSTILSEPDSDSPARKEAFERFVSLYWRPVYCHIRAVWHRSVQDAKDLTQDFFCQVLQRDSLATYEPARGRFRSFLKGALQNFMAQHYRDEGRQKRGGDKVILPLTPQNVEELESGGALAAEGAASERIFDRQWAKDVVARSLETLCEILEKEGKQNHVKAYRAFELHPGRPDRPSYDEVAAEVGLTVSQVTNYLHVFRERLQKVMMEKISEYATTSGEAAEEIRELFSA